MINADTFFFKVIENEPDQAKINASATIVGGGEPLSSRIFYSKAAVLNLHVKTALGD